MASNTINGKAFEYACLHSLYERARNAGLEVILNASNALNTACKAYNSFSDTKRSELDSAANTAVNLLVPLEPRLLGGRGMLSLSIAADAVAIGREGDVRDVLFSRENDNNWSIGISCKHNHAALRHPRVTEGKDFGFDWIGIPCSQIFMDEITPITDSLTAYGQSGKQWRSIEGKQDRFYVPILQAYLDEIKRLCDEHPDAAEKLLSYFFGSNDFYKVIMKNSSRTTMIEGFNMHGTLNVPCGRVKAMTKVSILHMPTRLIDAAFKADSKTTIILTFDGGWSVSMRLHNKDKIAKPTSLAWDVNLIGLPPSVYVNTHSWDE